MSEQGKAGWKSDVKSWATRLQSGAMGNATAFTPAVRDFVNEHAAGARSAGPQKAPPRKTTTRSPGRLTPTVPAELKGTCAGMVSSCTVEEITSTHGLPGCAGGDDAFGAGSDRYLARRTTR